MGMFTGNKYNPVFWAQEGLYQLQEALGMTRRVYWGYSEERQSMGANLGDTVTVTIPGNLTATNDPTRPPEELNTSSLNIKLDLYVKSDFQVSDRDLAFGGDQIITDHIQQAIYRVVQNMDTHFINLGKRIPWRQPADADISNDLINGRTRLFEAGVAVDREPIHYMVDSLTYGSLLKSGVYSSGGTVGALSNDALIKGSLSERFGVMPFPMQSAAITLTAGTIATQATAQIGSVSVTVGKGASSITLAGLTAGLTIVEGDVFGIEGSAQKYTSTTAATVAGDGTVTVGVWPPLVTEYLATTAVTFDVSPAGASMKGLIMFNQRAFAIVPAPLPMNGKTMGSVLQYTVTDDVTGLSLRATMSYDSTGVGRVIVKYDALFGGALIDPNRAVLICRPA